MAWRPGYLIDVFGEEGTYVETIEAPPGIELRVKPYVMGDRAVFYAEDAAGTGYVKILSAG